MKRTKFLLKRNRFLLISSAILVVALAFTGLRKSPEISIVTGNDSGKPVKYGLRKLTEALDEKSIQYEITQSLHKASAKTVIFSGLEGDKKSTFQLVMSDEQNLRNVPEAYSIRKTEWQGKTVWVITGSDNTGLMYGLLNVVERIAWSTDRNSPFGEISEITEKPDVRERAISLYTMQRAYWESRLYDEQYWERYLDMLAKNRFNSLVVIFGYENGGFMAPPYPYFFDLEEFPEIYMVGLTEEQQQHNLNAFRKLMEMCHERAIKFHVGIWDHIYRGGVQGGGIPGTETASDEPVESLVWGVDDDNLVPYTKAALSRFIQVFPGLDGIQFRIHDESGIEDEEQADFWRDIFEMIKREAPDMQYVLRAKGMQESVIQTAIDAGVDFAIGTKYWMEQMGMPFHPSHINPENQFDRRHGYADMLKYPKQYNLQWRLWNGGTTRILLWGNPEYVRRFAESTHLYDGDGFEVNEPLATKMLAQPHDMETFDLLKPEYQYYDYEFERYWHFFQVFGRMTYNPETNPEIWHKEFERRFGKKAAPLIEKAIHKASWILPRIVASVYYYRSSFPTTRGWAEKQRLEDLPVYARGEGSDVRQFAGFDEEAKLLIEGDETAKILPSENSLWFEQTSAGLNKLIEELEKLTGNTRNREFISTITDLKILSNLALYHSRRIPAAVSYCLFERTNDLSALESAITYEDSAIDAWKQIVKVADGVYADDLMMGVRKVTRSDEKYEWVKELSGHWKDELVLLEKGLEDLKQQKEKFKPEGRVVNSPVYKAATAVNKDSLFQIKHEPVKNAEVGEDIEIDARANAVRGVKWVRVCYRNVNQQEDYKTLEMLPGNEENVYKAIIPAEDINPKYDFMYFIEIMDENGRGMVYPDLMKQTPYIIVNLIR